MKACLTSAFEIKKFPALLQEQTSMQNALSTLCTMCVFCTPESLVIEAECLQALYVLDCQIRVMNFTPAIGMMPVVRLA